MAKHNPKQKVEKVEVIAPEIKQQYNPWVIFGGLFAVVLISYGKIWNNGFVWDDDPYIILNEAVKNFNLRSLLLDFHVGNYHPLTMLSLAIEYWFVGERTWLAHFNNLLIHSANSFLLYVLIKKLNIKNLVAVLLAFFFALHPMHVESVAWAAERKDVLYTFFLLLSFIFYLNYSKSDNKLHYGLSLLFFLASCLSKGMAVVLPALLIVTDWWIFGKKFTVKNLVDKIPYFALTLIFAYIATTAQKDAGADASSVINSTFSASERFRIVCYSFLFYWVKTVVPINLLPFYPYPVKIGGSIPAIYNLSVLVLAAFMGVTFWLGRKNHKIWWAVAFFTIAISTVLQILPVGSAIVADRYYYLSSIGPLFLIAYGLGNTKGDFGKIVSFGLLIVWAGITFFQTGHWKNGYTLFKPAEKFYPEDAMVLSNIGWYHLGQKEFPMAKQYLMRADNNGFKNADVCRTIGSMYIDEGDYKNALAYLEKAQLFLPKSPRTDWLTALAYLRTNEFAKALPFAQKASKDAPDNLEYLNSYAQALMNLGRFDESNAVFREVIAKDPENWDAYLNISYAHKLKGDTQTEIKLLDDLIKKQPSYLPAYRNIGVTFSDLGMHDQAVQYWQRATVYDSTGDYDYNIGINFSNRARIAEAKDWYIKAARKGKPEAIQILKQNGIAY
ncbi:MAG TPA: tetratricopeptide repeat protein [Leadbetterella sp.]|nr:tetratricopeptide repeat protein [Leadbetterella sp.]